MSNLAIQANVNLPENVKYWSYETKLIGKETYHLLAIDSTHIYYNFHEWKSRRDKALGKVLEGTPISVAMKWAYKAELTRVERVEALPWIQKTAIYSDKKIEVDTWGSELYKEIFQELNNRLGGKVQEQLASINESAVPNYYVLAAVGILFFVGAMAATMDKNEKLGNMAGAPGEGIIIIAFEISKFTGPIGGWILMIIALLAFGYSIMRSIIHRPTKEIFYAMNSHFK